MVRRTVGAWTRRIVESSVASYRASSSRDLAGLPAHAYARAAGRSADSVAAVIDAPRLPGRLAASGAAALSAEAASAPAAPAGADDG